VELDATEWCGGRQCGAHWQHGPLQWQEQADGANAAATGASPGVGTRHERGRAARVEAVLLRAGSVPEQRRATR
jgi:hypothetical protein